MICAVSGVCSCGPTLPSKATQTASTPQQGTTPLAEWSVVTPLEPAEMRRLLAGELVQRAIRQPDATAQRLGGLAYQLVPAPQAVVSAALFDVGRWTQLLPNTFSVQPVDAPEPAGRFSAQSLPQRVRLTQGNRIVQVQYTVLLEPNGADSVSFWLDRASPHDIADAWGFFECRTFDKKRSLIVVGTSLDVGSAWIHWLLGDRIESLVLSTPQRIVDHVVENRQALQRAAAAALGADEPGQLDAALEPSADP